MNSDSCSWPILGCGVGLRSPHYPVITEKWPKMDWFEAISENYMDTGGRPLRILEQVRHHYPIALHGTALSIGSSDLLNQSYLERLKKLVDRIDPFIVSDHLCWSGVSGEQLHDLLPLPFTEEAIRHVVRRVERVQEFLGRRILLENVSTYVTYQHSAMAEWEFLTEIAKRSGSGILLDLNNVYVNAINHQFDPHDYVRHIPGEFVGQIHLAGHTDMGSFLFDTHSRPIIDLVWELYREALKLLGPISTLIEWDEDIPPFENLVQEAEKARSIYKQFEGRDEYEIASVASLPRNDGRISRSPIWDVIARRPQADEATPNSHSNLPNSIVEEGPVTPPLQNIQDWIKSRIQPIEQNQPLPPVGSPQTFLNPQGGVPGEERMAVYANGYLVRIREALAEVYEALRHVLGEDKFSGLCHAYVYRHPSFDYNLNFVGKKLPEFLESSLLTKSFPFLPDLARLEWLVWRAFHAFEEPALDSRQIAEIPMDDWEKTQIIFQPSVGLISSLWPILDIWRIRRDSSDKMSVDLTHRPQQILIGRRGDQVRCEGLDENQYRLLSGLLSGKSLGVVCEELAGAADEQEFPIAAWFSEWVRDGLIARCKFVEQAALPVVPH